ncbi:DUF4158 domain-containing protein, partial [Thiorhodococcus minor]
MLSDKAAWCSAYPWLRGRLTEKELEADYGLSDTERQFVSRRAYGPTGRLTLAVLLKMRRRLGRFVALTDVPEQIRDHVATALGLPPQTLLVDEVGRPATVHRYRTAIREHWGSRPFADGGRAIVLEAVHRGAQTMSDPADLISASIEALVKAHVELPAFSTLDRLVGSAREAIHGAIYARIDAALNDAQRRALDGLLEHPAVEHLNTFSRLKPSPRPPTLKHRGQWTDRLAELDAILD